MPVGLFTLHCRLDTKLTILFLHDSLLVTVTLLYIYAYIPSWI